MEDVYKPPNSEMTDGEFEPISFGKKIACTIFVLVAVGIYFGVYKIISHFEEVLSGFGAELPKITSFVLSSHSEFIWLVVISIIPLALWSNNIVKYKYQLLLFKFGLINCIAAALVLPVAIWAMYAPIFASGSTV